MQEQLRQRALDEAMQGYRLTEEEYQQALSELRSEQKYIVDWLHHVYNVRREYALGNTDATYPPFLLFISGEGGTGKTFLLKVMREKIERMTETSGGSREPRVVGRLLPPLALRPLTFLMLGHTM